EPVEEFRHRQFVSIERGAATPERLETLPTDQSSAENGGEEDPEQRRAETDQIADLDKNGDLRDRNQEEGDDEKYGHACPFRGNRLSVKQDGEIGGTAYRRHSGTDRPSRGQSVAGKHFQVCRSGEYGRRLSLRRHHLLC